SLHYSPHISAACSLFHSRYSAHLDPLSFPTRRSSDLSTVLTVINNRMLSRADFLQAGDAVNLSAAGRKRFFLAYEKRMSDTITRSEEHTSELQSRENLVCRLLLEKKKTRNTLLSRVIH